MTPYILESLRNPAAYPVQTRAVELVQTHISWLFLTDTHVFKLKKPVNFGFLDFSTLDRRRFYCYEELRLNRRLCPDIYEQVIELRETDAGAAFVGNGKVIEYAVMMKRLPADRMLDRLVDSGRISVEEIQIIVFEISRFHSNAATSPHISQFGSLEQIQYNWRENFEQALPFQTTTLPLDVFETIRSYVETFTTSHSALFAERINNGYIRECDGDIHLGNICLLNNAAYIFDCIEFNERFRYSDTAADIAFLLMDLDFHSRSDLADAALTAYITASGDSSIAKVITFYKVYRAFVRGKVESMQLQDAGIAHKARAAAERNAIRYFRLAQGYCLRSVLPPTLFITSGTMGCGKSTLAGQLAFELGLATFNSDTIRKQLAGVPPETAVKTTFGAGLYSKEMSQRTYRKLEQLADNELASRHSTVIDAGFGTRDERAEFARLAASRGAEFIILFVQCHPDEQRQRLRERSSHGDSVSDGRVELLDQQTKLFEPPDVSEGRIISISTNEGAEFTLKSIYAKLFRS
ncbi:MAG: AAA family ATPase [Desulfuromonadaceae bacterium]|nr:AAA family ATPase [Desulfuromonadaceae bacterium]